MAEGKPPFTLSGKPGDGSYQSFLANETRYSSLARKFPDRAQALFAKSALQYETLINQINSEFTLMRTAMRKS